MKKLVLGMVAVLLVAIGNVWAATYQEIIDSANIKLSNNDWAGAREDFKLALTQVSDDYEKIYAQSNLEYTFYREGDIPNIKIEALKILGIPVESSLKVTAMFHLAATYYLEKDYISAINQQNAIINYSLTKDTQIATAYLDMIRIKLLLKYEIKEIFSDFEKAMDALIGNSGNDAMKIKTEIVQWREETCINKTGLTFAKWKEANP